MENASKALIIAGAILITLIIIGLGVAILGSTEGATDTSTFDAMQVSSFNNKFKPYEGTIQGSKLDTLCDILLANVRAEGKNKAKVPKITLESGSWSVTLIAFNQIDSYNPSDKDFSTDDYISMVKHIKEEIKSAHRYKVELKYSDNNDLVNEIIINE